MSFAKAVPRGCGEARIQSGCYFESGLSHYGSPIEDFLCDPPLLITPEMKAAMGIAAIGTSWLPEYERECGKVVMRGGEPVVKTWHILDVIGQEHYPTVSQFVEEARKFGVSRRLAANLEWERITRDTRLVAAHAKAYVTHTADFEEWCCPKHNVMHKRIALGPEHKLLPANTATELLMPTVPMRTPFCCAGVWWEDEIGEPIEGHVRGMIEQNQHDPNVEGLKKLLLGDQRWEWWDLYGGGLDRLIEVKMPSLKFLARKRPLGIPEPRYQLAIFGRFPLGRIAVVAGGEAERNLERASKASVLVEKVDQ